MSELIAFLEKVFDKAYPLMIVAFVFVGIMFLLVIAFFIRILLNIRKHERRYRR